VVDAAGRVITSAGPIEALVFPRSAVKPLQALPLIESGAVERLSGIAPVRWTPMTLLREVFAYAQVTSTLLT